MNVTLMMCFNQSILQLYQKFSKIFRLTQKFPGWIIDPVIVPTVSIPKYNPLVEPVDIVDNEYFN